MENDIVGARSGNVSSVFQTKNRIIICTYRKKVVILQRGLWKKVVRQYLSVLSRQPTIVIL